MAKNIVDSIVAKEAPGACDDDDDVEETPLQIWKWHLDEAEYDVSTYRSYMANSKTYRGDVKLLPQRYARAIKNRDAIKKRYDEELAKQDKA